MTTLHPMPGTQGQVCDGGSSPRGEEMANHIQLELEENFFPSEKGDKAQDDACLSPYSLCPQF